MYEKPQAPASIGGVLDDGFKLFRAAFPKVVILTVVATVVSQIPSYLLTASIGEDGLPNVGLPFFITMLVTTLFGILIYAAVVSRISRIHDGRDMSLGDALGAGLACMLPLAVCLLLYSLAVTVGMLLLLIPGLILVVTLVFAPYILVVEGGGMVGSLRQSHRLVWGNFWRTSAILLIAGFILMVAYVVIGVVLGVLIAFSPEGGMGTALIETLVTGAMLGLVTPLFYTLSMAAYYDLRLRKEGDDLADRIETPAPA